MTKANPKSEFYKDTTIPSTLLDELMKQLPAMPTQEDLFRPEGVVKQLSAALIERCLQAELSTHLEYEKNQRAEEARRTIAMDIAGRHSKAMLGKWSWRSREIRKAAMILCS